MPYQNVLSQKNSPLEENEGFAFGGQRDQGLKNGGQSCLQEIDTFSKITQILLRKKNSKKIVLLRIIVHDWGVEDVLKWL